MSERESWMPSRAEILQLCKRHSVPHDYLLNVAYVSEDACRAAVEKAVAAEQQVSRDELREAIDRMDAELARVEEILKEERARHTREVETLRVACEEFRESVLHQRGPMAENGMVGDQVNDVLGLYDDTVGAALAALEEGK